jgi:hypothetical protein
MRVARHVVIVDVDGRRAKLKNTERMLVTFWGRARAGRAPLAAPAGHAARARGAAA